MRLYNSLVDLIVNKPVKKGVTFISGESDEVFISYSDLYEKAIRILYNLQKNGIRNGNELVFQIKDNYEFVCCFWACILGGIIPVPVAVGNKSEHRQKLFNIWEVLNNPYLLTDKGTNILEKSQEDGIEQDKILEVKGKTVFIEDITVDNGIGELYGSTSEDIAFIQFSSGSTGDPKGVILTHRNLLTNVSAILSGICVSEKDTSLSWMPLTHDMGLIGFHIAPLAAGIDQYIMDTSLFIRNPILWIKKANEHRLTILSSPNFGYKYFLEYYKAERVDNWDLSNVRIIFNGAEPISVELCKRFLDELSIYGLKSNVLFNVYGMAEASLAVTFPPYGEELASIKLDREFLYIGQSIKEFDGNDYISAIEFADVGYPVTDCRVRICDNNGTILGENTVGNIEIKGDNVTSGYYNNRNATLKAFKKDNWLDTGDLGFFRNGRLIVTGRAKDVIFVNGQNYYAHDVERVSEGVEGVELGKAATCGVFNRTSQKDDIILFVIYKKKIGSFVKLASDLKRHIYKHMGLEIENVIPVKSFPKTTSGKIQRYKLGEMYQNGEFDKVIGELKVLTNNEPYENIGHFGDTTEEILKNICCDVLGLRSIGLNENLIELGADSLKSAILASRIQKQFNADIPIEKLFESGTLKEILSYIEKADNRKYQCIEPAAEKSYYPVTSAQKRVLSLDQLGGVGTSYNIPAVMLIEGDIDFKRLEKVFDDLVQRHESLRTSFEVVEGQTVQKIHENVNFSIETDTLLVGSNENVIEIINSLAEKFIRPFNLFQAPLMRVKLVNISEKVHALLLDIHHIISDGTSMGILIRDFAGLYRGEKLNPLKVQYKDYAQWRHDFSETDVLNNQESYWLERFKGEVPVLSMPLDYIRPAIKEYNGYSIRFSIQSNLKEKLKKLGEKSGASLFMIILAAYNVLLSKYTGQEDIVVGSPVAGRKHPDVSDIVGMFVNTLPLRNFPLGEKLFLHFLEEVKKDALRAYEYQDYQFEHLVEKLDIKRDMSRNPLFDTMLVMQNMDIPEFEIEGLKFNQCYLNSKSSKFDLTLEAVESSDGVTFNLEYCTALFKRETMERLTLHFQNILERIAENSQIQISQIEMLTSQEKSQILFDFNNTQYEYPRDKTISCVFEEQAKKTPDNVAVMFGDKKLTYRELNQRANSLARVLREQGVKGDSIVGVMLDRSLEMITGILAVLKAGGAYLPVSPDYPEERVRYILKDSGTGILLTNSDAMNNRTQEVMASLEVTVINLDESRLYQGDSSNLEKINTSRNLAYIIYTSGSTGKPKGAMIEHYSVINRINWMQRKYPIGNEDVILQKTTYTFDVSVWELFWWFFAGAKVYFLTPGGEKDPGAITDAIEKYSVTTMHFVPSMLNMFLEYMENGKSSVKIASLKQVFASGEALQVKQVQRFNQLIGSRYGTKLINLYGPTEATVDVSYFDCPEGQDIGLVPIGKPIDNIQLYVVDKYNNLQPVGIPGELCISGDGLARGYLNRPELTAEKFVFNPFAGENSPKSCMYRTGDLARWLPDGNIEYLGRIDHQVKIRGFRIELGEIEEELLKHESIKEVVVAARTEKEGSSYLCAYMVSDRDIAPGELREYLTRNLPEYMVPSYFVRLEKMPLSQNGKVDRKALPELELSVRTGTEYVEPSSKEEQAMAKVWEKALGLTRVGINDDFFELGGDSIKAIQVVSLLAGEGLNIEVKDILVYRTISKILLNVEQNSQVNDYEQGIIDGNFGFTPVVKWFFNKRFNNPNYFNQSILLELKNDIDIQKLEMAFVKIIEHHDGLRVNYSPDIDKLYFNNRDLYQEFNIESFNIAGLTIQEQEKKLEEICMCLKAGFDIEEGLLIKAAIIHFGDNDKLFITIHHLAVDGVSWRIILEDLFTAYEAMENGSHVSFPQKTASLKDWYEKLVSIKNSENVMKEKDFWNSYADFRFELPVDTETEDWSTASRSSVKGYINEEETSKLLTDANKTYNTSAEDLLVTALAKTVKDWAGLCEIVIEMENNGRNLEGINVARTLGWFTAMYPLKICIDGDDTGEQIKQIKESIREVPQNGVGYGILKYLTEANTKIDERMTELRFNYLGRFDKESDNHMFTYSHLKTGSETCLTNAMTAKLEINCMVVNGRFEFEVLYNNKAYKEETMSGFRDRYMSNLKNIISCTVASEDVYFTPSDFDTLDMEQEELDSLFE